MKLLNPEEPLGLPAGSVRAIITLGIVGITLALLVQGQEVPEILAGAFAATLLYYGVTRALAKNGGG